MLESLLVLLLLRIVAMATVIPNHATLTNGAVTPRTYCCYYNGDSAQASSDKRRWCGNLTSRSVSMIPSLPV